MIRTVVRRAGILLGREVQPGDVVCIDLTSNAPVVLAATLPRNVGQLLGAIEDGMVETVDLTPDDARALLSPLPTPPRPRAPRVLDLQARLPQRDSA